MYVIMIPSSLSENLLFRLTGPENDGFYDVDSPHSLTATSPNTAAQLKWKDSLHAKHQFGIKQVLPEVYSSLVSFPEFRRTLPILFLT